MRLTKLTYAEWAMLSEVLSESVQNPWVGVFSRDGDEATCPNLTRVKITSVRIPC